MSYKLMMRLVEQVESGTIKESHPLIGGPRSYKKMKRELKEQVNGTTTTTK
jgi:hypothetical protein